MKRYYSKFNAHVFNAHVFNHHVIDTPSCIFQDMILKTMNIIYYTVLCIYCIETWCCRNGMNLYLHVQCACFADYTKKIQQKIVFSLWDSTHLNWKSVFSFTQVFKKHNLIQHVTSKIKFIFPGQNSLDTYMCCLSLRMINNDL